MLDDAERFRVVIMQKFVRCLLVCVALLLPFSGNAKEAVHHHLKVILSPTESLLKVTDTVTLPQLGGRVEFLLHGDVEVIGNNAQPVALSDTYMDLAQGAAVPVKQYQVVLEDGASTFSIQYQGKIHHVIHEPGEEYARSFSETPGLIDTQGVFLANSTFWYPIIKDRLVKFDLHIELPVPWSAVSQGERTTDSVQQQKRVITWIEENPQDDIYIVAGEYKEYRQSTGSVLAQVFLQQADDALAQKYLDTTAQYIAMYNKLLGPYPYTKFALVENFWETGYGMPSFTLLGPKVIRFPFILHSSYPHEILHNWWGNGVYVDYDSGNWAEGLTAYLADHLIKEQRGAGAEYRRSVLQKYTDYVNSERDFALTEFRSRHSSSTEAVGYGKTMMLFHMLRRQMGDADFVRALRRFYRENKFKLASFTDLQTVFKHASDINIDREFDQWVKRSGAPSLKLNFAKAESVGQGFHLNMEIEQTQSAPSYILKVPVAVHLEGEDQAFQTVVELQAKKQSVQLQLPAQPLRIDIDPEFDLFRRLDAREIPSALSQGFGAQKVLVLLPSQAPEVLLKAYRHLAQAWQGNQEGDWNIRLDSEVSALPSDQSVWLLGWRNKHAGTMAEQIGALAVDINSDNVRIGDEQLSKDKHSVLLTSRNPSNANSTVLWLATDVAAALPGLARKLPHYRKYSYLAFAGEEPNNVLKGQWQVLDSPMTMAVQSSSEAQPVEPVATLAKLKPRTALAQLPPVFSQTRMLEDIQFLASEEMAGRELGSPQLDQAADYIAKVFEQAGLEPGGSTTDSYFQSWEQDLGEGKGKLQLKNVVGILPGVNKKLAKESVIVSAHYDHLGKGWPDVHKGDEGKIHFGADDNASGVAVMLELIRTIAAKWKPQRSIVFIAFTAEEAVRAGSIHYVQQAKQYPIDKIIGVLNLDTVGRLGNNPVTVFGTGSAREWVHIFRGTGFVTGIKVKSVDSDFGFSDQKSFIDVGVPGVQFFGSVHTDYHKPQDTIDKIDADGLIKVAALLKEAVEYLANREEPLNVTLARASTSDASKTSTKSGRKVSFGTIPDFAYKGKGVKITGVVPQSPAHKAGLKEGDVIVRMKNTDIVDLSSYAKILRSMQPGDHTDLTYERSGKAHTVEVTVTAR